MTLSNKHKAIYAEYSYLWMESRDTIQFNINRLFERVFGITGCLTLLQELFKSFEVESQPCRVEFMHYFLTYGRQLTQEELDQLEEDDKAVKRQYPTLDQFREQGGNSMAF